MLASGILAAGSTSAGTLMGTRRVAVRASGFERQPLRRSAVVLAATTKVRGDVEKVQQAAGTLDVDKQQASRSPSGPPAPPPPTNLRNIVFVSSEVSPWSKTGGLADVIGSLPVALAGRGHRVMVVSPRYDNYDGATLIKSIDVLGAEVHFYHLKQRGVDWIFVEHPSFHRPGGIYADQFGPYGDNQFRFTMLCLAGLEAPLQIDFGEGLGTYGQDCVFVANDWHAALVPVYLAAKYRPYGVYLGARSVLAIHNLRHQGVFPPGTFPSLGLPDHWYGALEYQYPPHQRTGSWAEEGRSVNHLKAGIATADRLLTVSPGYAGEITSCWGGWGLEDLLSSRAPVLSGIVNGIDSDDWDPATDVHIACNYDVSNFKEGKAACKKALQEELGLPVNPDIPLIAFIGRLDAQKGADLVLQAAPWMMSQGVQLVCLGSGTADLENGLRWLEAAYPNQARGWVGFNVALSHRLTAAADFVLMPSRFEPCGLNQLYAMRYGAVPIAHKTGGLKDTVINFDPWSNSGTGWVFEHCDSTGLVHATSVALSTMREHAADFEELQRRGMERDSSWQQAAVQYEQIFEWAIHDLPWCK